MFINPKNTDGEGISHKYYQSLLKVSQYTDDSERNQLHASLE